MRNDLEFIILKYGPFWLTALAGVALQKMFSKDPTTLFKVFRSCAGALICSTLSVIFCETMYSFEKLLVIMIFIGLFVDIIIPKVIDMGPKLVETAITSLVKILTGGKQ